MKFKRVFWVVALITALSSLLYARAAQVALGELVKKSEVIVIGKVSCVWPIDGGRIAWLEVTQTLKGDPKVKQLAFWASPTWMCDINEANEGETVLLLLTSANSFDSSGILKKYPSLSNYLKRNSPNSPLFFVNESGAGRMVITNNIVERNGYVIYPKEIQVVERRPLQYGHRYFSLLKDVVGSIQTTLSATK